MKRRSSAISGWVRFPVDDPSWKNSNEGGMVVKLVVCDNREFDDQFGVCCGAVVHDVLAESFVGDDRRPPPKPVEAYDTLESVHAEQQAMTAWEAYHFPRIVRVTADTARHRLETFRKTAGLPQYVDAGEAPPTKLTKLEDFPRRSISSRSRALRTGAPAFP